ncbi:hypothetical protein GCM10020295_50920 [Streptomyces cinereospinus]
MFGEADQIVVSAAGGVAEHGVDRALAAEDQEQAVGEEVGRARLRDGGGLPGGRRRTGRAGAALGAGRAAAGAAGVAAGRGGREAEWRWAVLVMTLCMGVPVSLGPDHGAYRAVTC